MAKGKQSSWAIRPEELATGPIGRETVPKTRLGGLQRCWSKRSSNERNENGLCCFELQDYCHE